MNYKKTKQLISKIKTFHDTMVDSEQAMSVIEKDLLLSYVRDLYEKVYEMEVESSKTILRSKPPKHEEEVEAFFTPKRKMPEIVAPTYAHAALESNGNMHNTVNIPAVIEAPVVKSVNPDLEQLFLDAEVKDLSDKLSMTPIADLTKSISINEKMFTIKELFNGSQDAFNTCIQTLNQKSSFEEAKGYLIGDVSEKYGWDKKENLKKVGTFIKLIRRRYL